MIGGVQNIARITELRQRIQSCVSRMGPSAPAPPDAWRQRKRLRHAAHRRLELEQLIDHVPAFEDVHFSPGLRVDPGQLRDGCADHQGSKGSRDRVLSQLVAFSDRPSGFDSGPGPKREIALRPVIARRHKADFSRQPR